MVLLLVRVLVPAREQVLGLGLGRVSEPALVPGQEQARVLEPALVLVPELGLGLHRQPNSRLTTMPAGLIIFSFSSIKTPPFRFWSAKIALLLKATTPFLSYLVVQARFAFN